MSSQFLTFIIYSYEFVIREVNKWIIFVVNDYCGYCWIYCILLAERRWRYKAWFPYDRPERFKKSGKIEAIETIWGSRMIVPNLATALILINKMDNDKTRGAKPGVPICCCSPKIPTVCCSNVFVLLCGFSRINSKRICYFFSSNWGWWVFL